MKSLKFSCSDDLREWLETKASDDDRSVSGVIRVLLYEAKLREEEKALA